MSVQETIKNAEKGDPEAQFQLADLLRREGGDPEKIFIFSVLPRNRIMFSQRLTLGFSIILTILLSNLTIKQRRCF